MKRMAVWLCLAAGLRGQPAAVPWSGYAHDPQHTGLSTVGAQRLEQIKWTTPVDLVLQGASGPLYIHYGSPLVTAGNTVLVPVRTSTSNTYRVEAHSGANGTLLYTLTSDFTPPPHNWIPSYGPALSQGTRLYYPGAGGTVYYRDQPDSASGPSGQIAFYGNALYAANQAAFAGSVMISTPITADANGNIYFGFDVVGSNPAGLTSGLARIGADGSGSWIGASAAAQGDPSIVEVAMNCAPAVSNDGSTLYFGVSNGGGYLVSVNSTTLAPIARIRLKDPETGLDALVMDDSSASPTVGPDGDVYYGVFESTCCTNDDRGWLLHFDAALANIKTPGAFGWDTTASVVPASLVPSYHGASSYLLFTKYNNYLGVGPGGNGHNKIAVLDPNGTEIDPITGATVMLEAITILGPTLDPAGNTNGSVREWCINSAAIDPFAASAIANSEDGVVYRWDFASNSFTQQVRLTAGVGEAYTPTAIGADGTAYAINDAGLFAVGQASSPTITASHSGSFIEGQSGAVYTLTVTNSGSGTTNGSVTVIDTLPASLTATSIAGPGWACTQPAGPCTRSDALPTGASYPAITLTVNVAANAPSTATNTATVSSDGAVNSVNATASDVTNILTPQPVLSIAKMHSGNFTQGQNGATYSVTVSDTAGAGPTSGPVTMTETAPQGMALAGMSGSGWTCPGGGNTCTRSDALAGGASYPTITVTVNVAAMAASPQVNSVSVSGGGSATASATDSTIVQPPPSAVSVTPSSGTGAQQTFALNYADPSGATDLADVWVWFTANFNTVSSANSCIAYYARATNLIFLLNDAGTAYTSAAPGAAVTLSNSQCSVNAAAASVTASGTNLILNLPVTFAAAYAGAKSIYMFASGSSANSGWQAMGTWTVPGAVATVSAVSVTPSSGSGAQQKFALEYADSLGATDLTTVWVWFTANFNTVSSANSCLLYYARATNLLFLLNDAGTAYSSVTPGVFTTGAALTLSNSQCSVNASAASVTPSGTNLTVNLLMTFTAAYAGTKSIYMFAAGSSANSGWQSLGSWTVPAGSAPAPVSVTPNGASGASQTFALEYADPLGATDLSAVWVWFTSTFNTVSSANSCIAYYARATNQILLINDAGTAYSSATPDSPVTLSNSNCSINAAAASVTLSGTDLTVNLPVTFAAGFAGAKSIFMFALGSSANSGWQSMGTWTVPLSSAPVPVSVTPGSGSGASQTFAFLYADALGSTDLTNVWVWFTSTFNTVSSANSCIAYYASATNQINLINDAGTAILSSATPGAAVTLSNSQCSINMATASIVTSGMNLTVNLPVTFTGAYAGAKGIFMYASGLSANSGWQSMGTWTVP
jgi:uncharacterized membrane protein